MKFWPWSGRTDVNEFRYIIPPIFCHFLGFDGDLPRKFGAWSATRSDLSRVPSYNSSGQSANLPLPWSRQSSYHCDRSNSMEGRSIISGISSLLVQFCCLSAIGVSPHDDAELLLVSRKSSHLSIKLGSSIEEKHYMAVVGEAASIAQLIVLAISTAQEVSCIYHSLNSSSRELESINNEVAAFSDVLNALHLRVGKLEGHRSSLDSRVSKQSDDVISRQFIASLDSSHDVLLKVKRLLPQSQSKNPNRVTKIFKAIAWHLKFPILQKALVELERHKSTLQLLVNSFNG